MTAPMIGLSQPSTLQPTESLYELIGKRLIDLTIVFLLAPVVLPLLGLILALTWIEGGSPLFVQRRVGRGGREFRCWKVRTMVADADRVLADLLRQDPGAALEWQRHQKLAHDPRVTGLGRRLRRTSLDELPQLWNVVNGTMSLVGPRPFTPEQRMLYSGGQAYFALRPGITGLWQVSQRHTGSFTDRIPLDEEYGRRIGLMVDLAILWRTFAVVLRATGA